MKKEISIHIGGLYISKEPSIIKTTLGSCISVCLYDPKNCIGGMNHFLLPEQLNNNNKDLPTKYGVNAMELLINGIMELGGSRSNLVSKVFGGARLLSSKDNMGSPGDNNSKFVLNFLRTEKIRVISRDLGGTEARKIFFHTNSGEIYLMKLASIDQKTINKESKYIKRIKKDMKIKTDITLFD